jgi:cobalt-zinc-cadmium efflux system membrane fusion protein
MRTSILFSLILAAGVAGCRKSVETSPGAATHAHGPDGDHEHEVETAQITVWTNGYEIFAEHTPPVVGKATRFITHVSDLRTGRPRAAGPLKFILRQEATGFDHPQAAPERPGIYIPAITFPAAGDWQASIIIPGETSATLELGTIKVFPTEDAAAHADYPDPPEGVPFLKEQQWRILAKTEPVARRSLTERIALHATVVAGPGSKAAIHSPVTGRLIPDQIVRLGAEVQAGDVLAWLEPAFSEFTAKLVDAEAEAVRAKNALDQAKTSFDRILNLYDQQAKSRRELQEADLAYRSAQASFEASSTIQQLYRATGATFKDGSLRMAIKAPFNGVVDQVTANLAERIDPDHALFTIINSKTALVQAHVPESRLTSIKPEDGAVLQPMAEGESPSVSNVLTFVAMGRELDPTTRTLLLTYQVANPSRTIPIGGSVTLLVATGKSSDGLAVPSSAIVEEEGIPIVFVQVSGETFQKRDVTVGAREGDWNEVRTGVSEGERVVTDGAYALLLSTKSGAIPAHGHAH